MLGWNDERTVFDWHLPNLAPFGRLDLWSNAANSLFAAGCEPQGFALLCSFAAPLMSLFPVEGRKTVREGGAVVSIVGGRRAGKTTAHTAAATVWGAQPQVLTSQPGRLKESLAYFRNLPIFVDKLANRDPQIVASFIRDMLTTPFSDYCTILVSFGGEPLRHGLVPEFRLNIPRGLIVPDKATPSALERAFLDNRGHAGPAFIAYLTQPDTLVWTRKMLVSKYGIIVDEAKLGHTHRFHIRVIAAAWVAALICVGQGILEMSPDRLARWAMDKAMAGDS